MTLFDHVALTAHLARLGEWAANESMPTGSLYLCGSALRKNAPRDWDVRLIMEDDEFEERFACTVQGWEKEGDTGQWTTVREAWSDECVRLSRSAFRYSGLNVDFQIYPLSHSRREYRNSPQVLIGNV